MRAVSRGGQGNRCEEKRKFQVAIDKAEDPRIPARTTLSLRSSALWSVLQLFRLSVSGGHFFCERKGCEIRVGHFDFIQVIGSAVMEGPRPEATAPEGLSESPSRGPR